MIVSKSNVSKDADRGASREVLSYPSQSASAVLSTSSEYPKVSYHLRSQQRAIHPSPNSPVLVEKLEVPLHFGTLDYLLVIPKVTFVENPGCPPLFRRQRKPPRLHPASSNKAVSLH